MQTSQAGVTVNQILSLWLTYKTNGKKKKTLLGGQYKARRTVIVQSSQFYNHIIFSTYNLEGNFMMIILLF